MANSSYPETSKNAYDSTEGELFPVSSRGAGHPSSLGDTSMFSLSLGFVKEQEGIGVPLQVLHQMSRILPADAMDELLNFLRISSLSDPTAMHVPISEYPIQSRESWLTKATRNSTVLAGGTSLFTAAIIVVVLLVVRQFSPITPTTTVDCGRDEVVMKIYSDHLHCHRHYQ